MSPTRRKIIGASTAAVVALSLAGPWHSQTNTTRQYHSPPENGRLQLYLKKIWETVHKETNGRISVTVYVRNNGAAAGDPEILTQLRAGEIEFFTLNGNIQKNLTSIMEMRV